MSQTAFVSAFSGAKLLRHSQGRGPGEQCLPVKRTHRTPRRGQQPAHMTIPAIPNAKQSARSRRVIGVVGKSATKEKKTVTVESESAQSTGIFGFKPKAHWDGIGVFPLVFAGFGVAALVIKMLKVRTGEWASGSSGVNKVTLPKSAITTQEEEAELHIFKCGGCGFEMYPARGREFKFFPDSFKCPLCGTPKSEFWDLNDPDDPRNQEEDEEDDDEQEIETELQTSEDGASETGETGSSDSLRAESGSAPSNESTGSTPTDCADSDKST
ncbi:hypothetical protein BWQ96_02802 [Gracilariopsis chorda]|uniref:Rubredoxin-like domain-containing protein n=1 Tax=Gracilariopsis chorda TaxID=448386 RepID=A0A2V3IZA5_9FLOR|nr:hypothetical protein BWQ96_02802 [Gracilariopsis chorda]|eukprot:PXF47471.1 hypothetical protein BWQ96_02802 [Gracilariopsis chorda]